MGGFVYAQLDKIPTVGDTVTYKDLTIRVLATKGRRGTKVKIVREASDRAAQSSEQNGGHSGAHSDANHRVTEANTDQTGQAGQAGGAAASSTPLGELRRHGAVSEGAK